MAEVSFGEWLRRRRNAVGLTQEQLALNINCSTSALRKFESEERRPSAEVVEQLADVFSIPQEERKAFLRFARGDWQAISGGDTEETPWRISTVSTEKQIKTATPRNNLPLQLTSFIGREKEQSEIVDLVGKHRLATLIGAGGIGKTRLSLEVARRVLNTFPDGLWFIELAPISDPVSMPQVIINTLGLIEQANRPPQTILADFLKAKRSLLVLDNCEHLLQACAQLTETLLQTCPQLHILVTSREALGISGEWIRNVATLSIPSLQQSLTTASLVEYEAVRLFLDRAQTAAHNFELTPENVLAITQICYHLDGIPLALELAAARLRGLSVEQIAARLDDRFHLLTSGARTVLPRHQTLQALIDWSHELLTDPERILLRRLSTFAGGWTLEAAEAVCSGDALATNQILDSLLHLVDKSLVVAEIHDTESRYHMLETIRQYARDKLWAAGEGEIFRQRHLTYFVDLAERAEPNLRAFGMIEWLDQLEAELDNIRVVLEWAQESNVEAQLRIASALLWFWHLRGHRNEGIDWLERGLSIEAPERGDQPITPDRAMIRGKALNAAGFLRLMLGETDKGAVLSEESLTLFRELGIMGKRGLAYALWNLSAVTDQQRNFGKSKVLVEQCLTLFQEMGDKFGVAQCVNDLGFSAYSEGDYELARILFEKHLALRKEIGDLDGVALAFLSLGHLASQEYDFEQASIQYEAGFSLFREVGNRWAASLALSSLGGAARALGDYRQAVAVLEEALILGQELGDKHAIARRLNELGLVARYQGDYDHATQMHEQALVLFREVGDHFYTSYVLCNLGFVALARADLIQAVKLFEEALAINRVFGFHFGIAIAIYGKGRVAQLRGNFAAARDLNLEAMLIFREKCDPFEVSQGVTLCLEAFAVVANAQNQMKRTIRLFGAAETLYAPLRFEMSAKERAEHDQVIASACAALGEEAFHAAWEAGQKMTLDEAIAYAVADQDN